MRRALVVAGTFGAVSTLTLLPQVFGVLTRDRMVGLGITDARYFPVWARWPIAPSVFSLVVAGALCALLLVAGRLGTRIFSVAFLISLAVYWWVLRPEGYWREWIAMTANLTPFAIGASVMFVCFLAASVLSFWLATRLRD